MKKVKIKITYEHKKVLPKIDERIKEIMDHIGAVWYAQGMNFSDDKKHVRDICFDLKID